MKKVGLFVLLAVAAVVITSATVENASALPAIAKAFEVKYKDSKVAKAAKAEKCNLCHIPKKKKTERNEYGQALSKFVTKDDYKKLKGDKPAWEEKVNKALEDGGKEKSSSGKTFAEKIEAGELPASS